MFDFIMDNYQKKKDFIMDSNINLQYFLYLFFYTKSLVMENEFYI